MGCLYLSKEQYMAPDIVTRRSATGSDSFCRGWPGFESGWLGKHIPTSRLLYDSPDA